MNPGIVDQFLDTFSRYIDSGFGLVGGDVAWVSTTLVGIDVTLAAVFWAWSPGEEVLARLIKKTLYVGFFAFLLSNFNALAKVVFESFSGLGLKAAGGGMSASDFLHPGKLAQAGIDAGKPLLQAASELCGFPGVFENLIQILLLLVAFLIVVIAFFVLAVQLFVCLIEFKLVTLAGFVLVPFGLFGRTAFLAEKVLGNVVASGVKVLVLAVIVGIGSTLFSQFTDPSGAPGTQPDLEAVLSLALAALTFLGLGIFGPGIANGLVSGAPQLGAGAAVGTAATVAGVAMAGAAGVRAIAGGVGAAASMGPRGGATPPGGPGPSGGGSSPPPSGPSPASPAAPSAPANDNAGPSSGSGSAGGAPAWASDYDRGDVDRSAGEAGTDWAHVAHGAGMAAHHLQSSDQAGHSQGPDLDGPED
ncbi:P-type conjugative transfer protein TrbL [Caulobacter sp. KR2-114]|uniref:P-type conjugative transfer protein TrbL n=1 Tax=Caulobacter sp. KR2-114 TaxID=3400912 RepID=UPI003C0BF89B